MDDAGAVARDSGDTDYGSGEPDSGLVAEESKAREAAPESCVDVLCVHRVDAFLFQKGTHFARDTDGRTGR